MRKTFAILTVALLVVACGGGNTKKEEPKSIEDQLKEYLTKMEKAYQADKWEEAEGIYWDYEEWVDSLDEEQMEELIEIMEKGVEKLYILDEVGSSAYYEDEPEVYMVYSNCFDGYLNVRAEPSSKSKVVGTLRNGPEGAELISIEGKWTKVRVNGVVGYIWTADTQSYPSDPVYIDASAVVGEWIMVTYSSGYCYEILENGKYLYSDSDGNEKAGTWYLSYHNLILKHSNGTTTVCTLENDMLTIGDWSYERYTE